MVALVVLERSQVVVHDDLCACARLVELEERAWTAVRQQIRVVAQRGKGVPLAHEEG